MRDKLSENEVKIVYYGPGIGGKTTNVLYIASQLEQPTDLISLSFPVEAYFKLTSVSLQWLEQDGMLETTLDKLQPLRNQKFHSAETFWKAIQDNIGAEQTSYYQKLILKYAHIKGRAICLTVESSEFHRLGIKSLTHLISQISLYVPPGSIYRDPVRREILEGTDGVIFVVDSQIERIHANIEMIEELEEFLRSYGNTLASLPWVIQYNKRDLPNILPIEELEARLNRYHVPSIEAIVTQGIGVLKSLTTLLHVIEKNTE